MQASILSALLVLISTGPLDLCRSAVSRRVAPIDITTVTQIYQDSEQNGPFGKSQKSLILTSFYQYHEVYYIYYKYPISTQYELCVYIRV